jgi:pyruvate oxidase
MGAVGYTIRTIAEVKDVFDQAMKDVAQGRTVLIDAKISGDRPLPAEMLELDPRVSTPEQIADFRRRYEAEDLEPLSHYLCEEGLESTVARIEQGGF